MHRFFQWALMVAAVLPSLWFAWYALGFPHLGYFNEDALYLDTAVSLAEGRGYRATGVPGEPLLTEFPPLFPAYLAPFVQNRWLLTGALWVLWPCAMSLLLFWLKQQGWSWRSSVLVCLALGVNAFTLLFTASILPEMLALSLLLAAFYLIEQENIGTTVLAALAAGGAYLTRTSLLAAGAGLFAYLLYRRRWRHAAVFAVTLAPAIVWWQIVVSSGADSAAQGGAFRYHGVTLDLSGSLVWQNLTALLNSAGRLLYFHPQGSGWESGIAGLFLMIAAAGVIRAGRVAGYHFFAMIYCAVLLVWDGMPNEQIVMPVFPLLLAGLISEGETLLHRMRLQPASQGHRSVLFGSLLGLAALAMVWRLAEGVDIYAKGLIDRYRKIEPVRAEAYSWVAANTSRHARFLAGDQTGLHLATGRQGFGLDSPTHYHYLGQREAMVNYFAAVPELGRAKDVDYLFLTPYDFERELTVEEHAQVRRRIDTNPYFYTVYDHGGFLIKRRTPPWTPALFPFSKLQLEGATNLRKSRSGRHVRRSRPNGTKKARHPVRRRRAATR